MLEQVVRPFQSPGSLATRVVVADNTQVQVTQARIIFGVAGTLPTPTVEAQLGFKLDNCNNTNKEQKRKTHLVRVQNPDDPSQYVMVENIDEIVFSKTPDDVQNDFDQVFQAFASRVAQALGEIGANSMLRKQPCEDKYKLNNQPAS